MILLIDTREKDPYRVSLFERFARLNGIQIEKAAVKHADYFFSEVELAIEFKTVSDICCTYYQLPERLYQAVEKYRYVALLICGPITVNTHMNGDFYVTNPKTKGEKGELLRYKDYQELIHFLDAFDIHVKQFDSLDMLNPTLDNLIDLSRPQGNK
jgi:hypothetical protein